MSTELKRAMERAAIRYHRRLKQSTASGLAIILGRIDEVCLEIDRGANPRKAIEQIRAPPCNRPRYRFGHPLYNFYMAAPTENPSHGKIKTMKLETSVTKLTSEAEILKKKLNER